MRTVAVIGDSHTCFWRGTETITQSRSCFKGIKVFHVGAATAFQSQKLLNNGPLLEFVSDPRHEAIIVSLGEIDARAHIVKQAYLQGRSLEDVATEVAAKYMETVDALRDRFGLPIIAWAPPPSMGPDSRQRHHKFTTVGSPLERTFATACLIDGLLAEAPVRPWFRVASIFELMLGADGSARPGVLYDGCHVAQHLMPDARSALFAAAVELGISGADEWFQLDWDLSPTFEEREVSQGLMAVGNSHAKEVARLGSNLPATHSAFVSEAGEGRRVQIDLTAEFALTRIVLHAAPATCPPEDYVCLVSRDNIDYATLADVSTDAGTITFTLTNPPPLARYVRLERSTPGVLAFNNLRIYGMTMDRKFPSL